MARIHLTILTGGQTTSTYLWKVCPTPTRSKNSGKNLKPRNFRMILNTTRSATNKMIFPSTSPRQTTLFNLMITWDGGATPPTRGCNFQIRPPCSTNHISPTQTKNSSTQLLMWKNIFSILITLSPTKTTSDMLMDCIPVRLPTTKVPNLNSTPIRKGIQIRKPQLGKGEPLKGFALPTRTLQRRPKPTRTIPKTAT